LKIKVRAFGNLIPILGNELIVELEEGAKISDLIQKISERKKGLKRRSNLYLGEEE